MSDIGTVSANERFARLFPDPDAPREKTSWWRHRRWTLAVVAVAIVLVVVLLATQAFGSSGPDYRLSSATTENVDAVLNGVGTIEPVSQATVAFPVAGNVASVGVKVGDSVAVGQTLASLDGQSLSATLDQKQAALAQAQLSLSKALAGQSVGLPSSGSGGSGSSGANGSTGSSATFQSVQSPSASRIVLTDAATSSDPALAAAQQAVLVAQQKVDAALSAASAALTSAQNVCANVQSSSSTAPATTAPTTSGTTGSSGPTAATTPPPTSTTTPPDNGITACQTALQNVLDAQNAVAAAQTALSNASNSLDALLNQRAATPPTTTTPPSGGGSGSGGSGSGGSGTGGSGNSGSGSSGFSGSGSSRSSASSGSGSGSSAPTAADLAAYQQAVDAATDQVAVAQQALAQASIATPIAGTVVAVNMSVGDSVSAASTTENIIVQGSGGYEVSTTVGVTQIPHVAVGDTASVVADGTRTSLPGKVASISVAPTSTNNTTTNYLVVIGLTNPNAKLNNGSTGTTNIVTQNAKAALAVPTSAVTTNGGRHTVEVYDGGSVRTVSVQVGVIGNTWTEIKSGITKGEQVVLADASQPLPGSATSSSNGTTSNTTTGRFVLPGGAGGAGGLGGLGGLRGAGGGGGTGGGR
jgi:HlyD family secretion protein